MGSEFEEWQGSPDTDLEEWPKGGAGQAPTILNGRRSKDLNGRRSRALNGQRSAKRNGQRSTETAPNAEGVAKAQENELGTILVKVQRFADEAEQSARALVENSEAEATLIIEEARRQALEQARSIEEGARAEATRIVADARQQAAAMAEVSGPAIPPQAIASLSTAISEFADTNRTLVEELVQLRNSLTGTGAAVPPVS